MAHAKTPPIGPASREQRLGHLAGFEGMRAIAAVGVLLYHALWRTPALRPLAPALGHADIGVEIFFVMSGFLVARPLVAQAAMGGARVGIVRLWQKRIARIWPAYLVALAGALVVGIGEIDGLSGALKHVLLIQTWFDDRGGTGLKVSWTLVVEVAFVALVVPLAALVGRVRRRPHDAWVVLCGGLLAFGAVAVVHTAQGPTLIQWRVLPPYLTSFATGMLLAGAEADPRPGTWCEPVLAGIRWLASKPALCFGLAAGAFAALSVLMPANPTTPSVEVGAERAVQSFVQVAVAGLALAPLALRTTSARWLERPVLVALGAASYGFYLWHVPVLRLVRPMLQASDLVAYAGVAIAVAVAFVAGEVSRRWIEDPARRILTRRRTSTRLGGWADAQLQ